MLPERERLVKLRFTIIDNGKTYSKGQNLCVFVLKPLKNYSQIFV